MRKTTQPIAIASSGSSSSANRRQRTTVESLNEYTANSSGDEQDYNPSITSRPFRQPFADAVFKNRNHALKQSANENFDTDNHSSNYEDLLIVGSLPSSRRERRFLVNTGGQEVGGYGAPIASRLVLAPKAWNPSQRTNSPPPAPLLGSRMDQERGEKISRIPKMALPESLASSLDSSSIRMSYGSLRENSFQRYYHNIGRNAVTEPQSTPHSNVGTSADVFTRLRSNNSVHKLNDGDGIISHGADATITAPLMRTNSKSSMSALASLLGDYTITDPESNTEKFVDAQSKPLDRNIPTTQGNVSEPSVHSGETWSYSSNHSDLHSKLWHLNSAPIDIDNSLVQSPVLSAREDFSGSSLTGLNILESTHNQSMNFTVSSTDYATYSPLHTEQWVSTHPTENLKFLPNHPISDSFYSERRHDDCEEQIDPDEAFDLEMDS